MEISVTWVNLLVFVFMFSSRNELDLLLLFRRISGFKVSDCGEEWTYNSDKYE
jgi:hypothetical protein